MATTLLLIRHAKAVSREKFAVAGMPDERRPLTKRGTQRFTLAATGLQRHIKSIAILASSPLKRAVQTAEILSKSYKLEIVKVKELSPEYSPDDVVKWLNNQKPADTIALVGHEPNLSELLDVLLSDKSQQIDKFKKGAVCMIQFPKQISAKAGTLKWMKTAKALAHHGEQGELR